MRLGLGLGLLGKPDDLIDLFLGDLVFAPSALADLGELGQPVAGKPRSLKANLPNSRELGCGQGRPSGARAGKADPPEGRPTRYFSTNRSERNGAPIRMDEVVAVS